MTTDDHDGREAERRWRLAAALLAAALLPLMLWASRDFGVTWDEVHRQANGERIWLLYQGIVRAPDTPAEHLKGGLFDVLAVALQPRLPFDVFDTRHLLNAFFGWLGIIGCGLIGLRAGGGRAAFFAIAVLAAWPTYFGHSMNNPKDIPFAALATLVLVALAWLPTGAPYLTTRHVLALGSAIGLTLGVRPGGLLFLGYAGLWVAATLWIARETNPRRLAATLAALAGVGLIACVVPMPVWPYLWERPVIGIVEAVEGVSHYEWYGTVLFGGQNLRSNRLPWTYIPVWLGLQTPLILQAGVAATLPILLTPGLRRRVTLGLWFTVLFPIAYVIARESTMYDGIRHMLFVMPPLAVLAALGWDDLIRRARGRWRAIVVCLAILGISEPLAFQIRNHPNQVVYFQPLAGGPSRAYARFELDYWGNCLYQALREAAILADATDVPVTVSGRQDRQLLLNAGRVPQVAVVSPRLGQHELEINMLRGRRADLRAFTVRDDIVWWVKTADGARLCAVQRGPQFERLVERLRARGLIHLLPQASD